MMCILLGCKQGGDHSIDSVPFQGVLFKSVPVEHSGVDFSNNLPESDYMNGFLYEYFYNGAGVGVGDVNNDGLEDIYFTSNLQDNKLYLNQGGLKFMDATTEAGVPGKEGWATGVSMVDLNQDGMLDIYVCRSGAFTEEHFRRNELFINQGAGDDGVPVFKEMAAAYGIDDPSYGIQAAFFDYDLDGDLDLFLANHNPESPPRGIEKVVELHQTPSALGGNKLYQNHEGRFEDVSQAAGFYSNRMNYTLGISISDINNDGWADIYLANDYSEPDYLYINQQDGTFREVSHHSFGHMPNASMGSDIADVNNDGLFDIMSLDMAAADNFGIKTSMSSMNPEQFYGHVSAGLHHQYMFNALQLNNGNFKEIPRFSDIAQMAGVSSTDWSWAPLLADFDGDGYKDLFVTNGVKRDFINNDFNIYLNNQIEIINQRQEDPVNHFAELTDAAPTREKTNYIFKNNRDLTFTDVSAQWAMEGITLSNGAAYADLDNDGDLDLVINNIDDPASIFENNLNQHSNFLSISLVGPENNRNGIGTRVAVYQNGLPQFLEQHPIRGYLSSVTLKLHFGFDSAQPVDSLHVTWPDGKQQTLYQLPVKQHLTLNYHQAGDMPAAKEDNDKLFADVSDRFEITFHHRENEFNDFEREGLLPHKMSQQGPALAVGDVNADGLQDFYIGGSKGYTGSLFVQQEDGNFAPVQQEFWHGDRNYEDVDALFFDADNDQDLDLIVVSGGNEYREGSNFYSPRIYENAGNGTFNRSLSTSQLPVVSGSVVRAADFDLDGDIDLFLGGRQKPGRYPFPVGSYLLRNDSEPGTITFNDVTSQLIPELQDIGMVTDAVWTDLDGDQLPELAICGEWMAVTLFMYNGSEFRTIDEQSGIDQYRGWWYSITAADFDKDGDNDLVVGNHGLNNKYKASEDEPFHIYTTDFDNNGIFDIVLGYYNQGELFPLRGRECTSTQMPFVKQRFTSYEAFGKATLYEVYGTESLSSALNYQVNTFATTYFENKGNMTFEARPLDHMAQVSSVKTLLVEDFDTDGNLDLILAGNMYETEVETPRNDASYGLFLQGDGKGNFESVSPNESGLFVIGDVKKSAFIELADQNNCILFAINGAQPSLVKINDKSGPPLQAVSTVLR